MRLITNFHDYYDSLFSLYVNEVKPIVERKTTETYCEIFMDHKRFIHSISYKTGNLRNGDNTNRYLTILGFCGRLYPFYATKDLKGNMSTCDGSYAVTGKHDKIPLIVDAPIDLNRWIVPFRFLGKKNIQSYLTDTMSYYKTAPEIMNLFIKYNVFSFVISPRVNWSGVQDTAARKDHNLILSPRLTDWYFQKIMTPQEVIQEIFMFYNTTLVKDSQPKIPVGTDVQLAESKGFDKWSFRKMPEIANLKNKKK